MNAPFLMPAPGGPLHAIYAPSSAHRWAAENGCSASAMAIAALPEQEEGEEAAKGTAAHDEIERVLAPLATGDVVHISFTKALAALDMEHESAYGIALVFRYVSGLPAGRMWIEQRVRLTAEIWGRCDVGHWHAETRTLTIVDFKNGFVGVDAERNEQLRIYAAATILQYALPVEWIRYAVVQPNDFRPVPRIKQWVEPVASLRAFADRVAAIPHGPLQFVAGEQCTYCPIIGKCQASRDLLQHLGRAMAYSPDQVPQGSVALFLAIRKAVLDWFKALESAQLKKALAGNVPPGMAIVTGTKHREWIDPVAARAAVLAAKGPDGLALPTPAQAAEMGVNLETLARTPPGGPVLAMVGDKRKPWAPKSTAEMFTGVVPQ